MIQKEKFSFASSQNQALSARRWIPDGDIRGIVQLVHGMAEHIDRYDRVAVELNGQGYAVAGHNHKGHGPETPDDQLGYFYAAMTALRKRWLEKAFWLLAITTWVMERRHL